MKKLTETFNSVTLAKGETFEIALEGIPSAGYLWQTQVVSGPAKLTGEGSVLKGSRQLVGGPVTQKFMFVAEEAGEIEIKAEYGRPWENKAVKSQNFKITVK